MCKTIVVMPTYNEVDNLSAIVTELLALDLDGLEILKEVPIYFKDRRVGQSKMSMPVQLEVAMRVLEIRWRHRAVRSLPHLGER